MTLAPTAEPAITPTMTGGAGQGWIRERKASRVAGRARAGVFMFAGSDAMQVVERFAGAAV